MHPVSDALTGHASELDPAADASPADVTPVAGPAVDVTPLAGPAAASTPQPRPAPTCDRCRDDRLGRGARWCPGCGAAVTPRTPRTPRARPPGPARHAGTPRSGALRWVASVLLLSLLVIGPAVVEQVRTGPVPPPPAGADPDDDTVSLPPADPGAATSDGLPATNPRVAALGTTRTSVGRDPTCSRADCVVWRSTILDQRPLLVTDGLAVHLGSYRMYGLDPDTGAWRWRRDHTDPRGVTPAAALNATYLDPDLLAIAYGARIRLHAASDGRLTGEADLAPRQVTGFHRRGDVLVTTAAPPSTVGTGAVAGGAPDPVWLVALAPDGAIRWEMEGMTLHPPEADGTPVTGASGATGAAGVTDPAAPLLVRHGEHLRRLDPATGAVIWSHPVAGRHVDGLTVLDPTTGTIEVLDPVDGEVVLWHRRPSALAAGVRSGVLVVVSGRDVEVVDAAGSTVLAAGALDPGRTVVVRTGADLRLVELPGPGRAASEPTVRSSGRLGTRTELPGGDGPPDLPAVPGDAGARELTVMARPDGILLADGDPRRVWVLDPTAGTLRRLDLVSTAAPDGFGLSGVEAWHADGLTFLRQGLELTVIGAAGELTVRGPTRVAGTDPLLVHGGSGTLRLDRGWLDDGPAREVPTRPLR